jgi:hypothetical protein
VIECRASTVYGKRDKELGIGESVPDRWELDSQPKSQRSRREHSIHRPGRDALPLLSLCSEQDSVRIEGDDLDIARYGIRFREMEGGIGEIEDARDDLDALFLDSSRQLRARNGAFEDKRSAKRPPCRDDVSALQNVFERTRGDETASKQKEAETKSLVRRSGKNDMTGVDMNAEC